MKKIYFMIFLFIYLQNYAQIASYNFTNGSGVDITGHGNNGTFYGNSSSGDTLLIGSNTNDYFQIPSSVLNGRVEFSLFFKIKFNALNMFGSYPTNHLFSGDLSNSLGSFGIAYEKDINTWYFVSNGFVCSFVDATIVADKWYSVCFTRSNAGLITFWIDGIKHSTTYSNTTPIAMTNLLVGQETDCYGGCFATNQASNAKFDYISIYGTGCSDDPIFITTHPLLRDTVNLTICSNNSVLINGNYVNQSGMYPDTVTNSNGCNSITVYRIEVIPSPQLTFNHNADICLGQNITLQASGADSVIWNNNFANGTTLTPDTSITYFVKGINTNGCTINDSVNVNVHEPFAINIIQRICEGDSIFLAGAYRKTSFAYNETGLSIFGCDSVTVTQLIVNPLPIINIATTDTILCEGAQLTLLAEGAELFQWSNEILNGQEFTPLSSGTFNVMGTDSNGCIGYNEITVMVNPKPHIIITATDDTICQNSPVILSAAGAPLIIWDNGVENFQEFIPQTTQSYTATGTSLEGCVSSSNISISVIDNPIILSHPQNLTICANEMVEFLVTIQNPEAFSFSWFKNGLDLNIHNSSMVVANAMTSDAGQYYCEISNICSSINSNEAELLVHNVVANITPDGSTTFCHGDSLILYASTGNNLTYFWFYNNVLISTETMPFLIVKESGLYKVQITNSITNCTNESNGIEILVNPSDFNLTFSSNQQLILNPPFAVQFYNNTSPLNGLNYTWLWGDNYTTSSNNSFVFHQYQYNGLYSVTLIATSMTTGCKDTLTQTDYIYCANGSNNPCNLTASITALGTSSICPGDSVQLVANVNAGSIIQWTLNGVIINGAETTDIFVSQPGEYRIIATQGNCNVTSAGINISSYQIIQPVINANGIIAPCSNDSVELYLSTFYNSYQWSNGQTQSSIWVYETGVYTISVTDVHSCVAVSEAFTINTSILPTPGICAVIVDSSNYPARNVVVWNKEVSSAISRYNVFRETIASGIYELIGSVAYTDPGKFIDIQSDPHIESKRYRISEIDTCGNETNQSDFHQTIHISMSTFNGFNQVDITDHYMGIDFLTYNIYRYTPSLGWNLIHQMSSTNSGWTDNEASTPNMRYFVAAVIPSPCYIGNNKDLSGTILTASSNIEDNIINTSTKVRTDYDVNVYPNPSNGKIFIKTNITHSQQVCVYNIIGQMVLNETMNGAGYISIEQKGAFTLKISDGENTVFRKIVVN